MITFILIMNCIKLCRYGDIIKGLLYAIYFLLPAIVLDIILLIFEILYCVIVKYNNKTLTIKDFLDEISTIDLEDDIF